jgi:hypothetical protein
MSARMPTSGWKAGSSVQSVKESKFVPSWVAGGEPSQRSDQTRSLLKSAKK